MMKKGSLIGIIIAILLLSSCQSGIISKETAAQIHVGTDGVNLRFIDKAPSNRMMEDSSGPIVIELQNAGAYDVVGGIWALSGDSGIFQFQDTEGSFNAAGKSKTNPIPGKELIETKTKTLQLDPQRQTHEGTITFTICYPYQTTAGINVCIDTDPLDISNRKKTCTTSTVSGGGGQGGPVSITKVEPDMVPDGDYVVPHFTIHIANSGRGLVVDPRKTTLACQPIGATKELFDTVEISAKLTDTPLDCQRTIKLEDGSGIVDCVATEGFPRALGAYTAPLTITLRYGYTQSITTQVNVERQIATIRG